MTEAPREIWAYVDEDDSGVFVEFLGAEEWPDAVHYIRADAIPLSDALAIPEIAALVEAVRVQADILGAGACDSRGKVIGERLRAALRKIEEGRG